MTSTDRHRPGRGLRARLWPLLGAATVLTPLAAHPALAQSAPETASGGFDEIVVTATRKEEPLSQVPISIQALTADKLEQHQAVNFTDYVAMLPSVSYDTFGPGRTDVYFRGISVLSGGLPTSAIYLDDMPITSQIGMPEVHVYDVERVEALSGPQGTLFGSSSLAGTLRIITAKPKLDKLEAGMDVQADAYGHGGGAGAQVQGYLNLPLAHNLALRVMAFYDHEGGYINNTPGSYTYTFGQNNPSITYTRTNAALVKDNYNPVTQWGGRATLLADFGDWSIMPSINYQNLKSEGGFGYDPRFSGMQVHDFTPTSNHDEWYQASLTVKGQVAGLDVTGVLGYFHRDVHTQQDYSYYSIDYDKLGGSGYYFRDANGNIIDPTQQATLDSASHKLTEELRISTPKSSRLQVTAGVFNQTQSTTYDVNFDIQGLNGAYVGQLYNTATDTWEAMIPVQTVRGNAFIAEDLQQDYKDFGLYGDASYPILDTLKLDAGIRWFSTTNRTYGFAGTAYSDPNCTFPLTGHLQCINVNEPYHQTGETHKASLEWQVAPHDLVYFTYSTGFRPGGGNNTAGTQPYKADTLDNFELGAKLRLAPTLVLNTAAYYENWKNVHYSVVVAGTQGSGATVNAGNARVYGIEADLNWKIGPITVSGSGAYNDARLSTNFCDLVSSTNRVPLSSCSGADVAAAAGTRLPRQPMFKGQMTVRYDRQVGAYAAYLQAVAFHQSGSTSDLNTANDALYGDPKGFQTFDFSLGARRGTAAAELFVQNAFNSMGVLSRSAFCAIQICTDGTRSYGTKPQYFGVRFSKKFQ
jgi:iron complex outermembrane recepter protein